MNLHANFIIDSEGKPISVVLPYNEYQDLIESLGLDLSKEEIEAIEKAKFIRSNKPDPIDDEYISLNNV
ncbi:MAG: hypothetical protein KJ666_18150 [Bacteroidetes bacterium]|nr:hypothetical protein [Bacteroidota bacterium]MBU2586277.1 hypothetical protein [Bacteroidota bacterium]